MQGKEYIINKIISDAEEKASKIVESANQKANQSIAETREKLEKEYDTSIAEAQATIPENVKRRVAVANLDVKKIILEAKQEIIDKVFQEVVDKVRALPKEKYLAYIKKLILDNAEDKDEVIVSRLDLADITKEFISGIAKEMKISLSLSKSVGDFSGGIILSGSNYDKNVTLEVELAALREEIEKSIVEELF